MYVRMSSETKLIKRKYRIVCIVGATYCMYGFRFYYNWLAPPYQYALGYNYYERQYNYTHAYTDFNVLFWILECVDFLVAVALAACLHKSICYPHYIELDSTLSIMNGVTFHSVSLFVVFRMWYVKPELSLVIPPRYPTFPSGPLVAPGYMNTTRFRWASVTTIGTLSSWSAITSVN